MEKTIYGIGSAFFIVRLENFSDLTISYTGVPRGRLLLELSEKSKLNAFRKNLNSTEFKNFKDMPSCLSFGNLELVLEKRKKDEILRIFFKKPIKKGFVKDLIIHNPSNVDEFLCGVLIPDIITQAGKPPFVKNFFKLN